MGTDTRTVGVVEPLLRPRRREENRGRPWHDTRAVLNGVPWILDSGAQWAEMPARYPPYQTCHLRFPDSPRNWNTTSTTSLASCDRPAYSFVLLRRL
jgi:transposase